MSDTSVSSAAAGRRARTLVTLGVLLAVGGVMAAMLLSTGKVGTIEQSDAGITKYVARVDADSSVTMPIVLQEGGDVVHESDHIFAAFEALPGIEAITVAPDGSTVTVRYDSSRIATGSIDQAGRDAGYLRP